MSRALGKSRQNGLLNPRTVLMPMNGVNCLLLMGPLLSEIFVHL